MSEQPVGGALGKLGMIGTRQLVAVQTFFIARLTSHPVALVPGTFVAVTGRGPKDSNESGKTSFLAAVALLLGDPEWRMAGGGSVHAPKLLFEPVTAGASPEVSEPAQVGYVVGVFADPEDPQVSAHTVWLQVSAKSPHVEVRHRAGVHLLVDGDDRSQHEGAAGFFRRLGGKPLGATEYAEVLYGRAPRLLAYIVSRGGMRSRPSLLKLDAGTFTPVQIGDALINLTGRAGMLARDVQDRQELEQTEKDLAEALKNAESSYRDEEQILHAVETRERARLETGRAHDLWRLASARDYVDTVVAERRIEAHLIVLAELLEELSRRESEVGQQLAQARDTRLLERTAKDALQLKNQAQRLLEEASEKRGELHGALKGAEKEQRAAQARAEGYDGPASDELAELLATHQGDLVTAKADLLRADERVDKTGQELADAREGRTGQAAAVLQALHAGPCPDAVGLMASTRLHPDARSQWEARLAPWRDAVCVPPSLLDAAVEAVRDLPGTVLIAGPPAGAVPAGPAAGWPAGIADAAPLARSFLQALADATTVEQPPHALLPSLGVHVVGGFEQPIVGQADICAHLEEQLVRDRAEREAVSARIGLYERRLTAMSRDIDRAKAKEEAARLADQARALAEDLAAHDKTLPGLRRSAANAAETAVRAGDALEGAAKRVQGLLESFQKVKKEIGQTTQKRDRMLELRGKGPAHPGLVWTDSLPEALAALNWSTVPPDEAGAEPAQGISTHAVVPGDRDRSAERRSSGELLSESRARLSSALARLSADSYSTGVATPELANALHHQEAHTEDPLGIIFRESLSALVTWLADNEKQDKGAREQVEVKRAERANEHRYLQDIVDETRESLAQTQQSIKERVLGSLRRISDKLNELHSREGYKADLLCEVTEPQTAQDQWVCHVVPRWQRNPNGPLLSYDRPTNTAQEKLFSIHLVLAALLAAPDARGRVLILDELGDSLGAEHRREVIAALRDAAQDHGITVLATCQDVLMTDVRLICGQILQFRYYSKSDALNRPTLMFGLDDNGRRVQLTLDALVDSRA
ncbi:hypothetical protein [Streptomyces paromomycinus]|uniref:Uncharacterized protein n=1 Tax=Streptomyces paromomycinus TaxID=92743 RepID=A0A401WGJ5_STREY|nr:hypothetical protein [Streptomyces paromomycinus]GCD48431.1 hypothetical protein GKJPGBOP_08229 [Streptomyces paromomycinus]